MERKLLKLKDFLEKADKILLLLHLEPDGDTIASSAALATYLKRIGKKCDLAVNGEIAPIFDFLIRSVEVKNDFLLGDYDLVIAVDCGDAKRTGFPKRIETISKANNKNLVNIDHHLKNNLHKIADLNIVDEGAAAAAEIVWDILESLGAKIDSALATCILAGIYYDTGGFQHSNVTDKTLKIASKCLRLGARIGLISRSINGLKSSAGLKLWGAALREMVVKENGLVRSVLCQRDLARAGATAEDAAGLVNLINTVPGTKAAVLLLEGADGTIRVSLRAERSGVDLARLARLFGGGGHRLAAGFSVEGKLSRSPEGWRVVASEG